MLQAHLRTLKGETGHHDWLRWALRGDGPLFFKTPSPMNSPNNQGDPRYQVSDLILLKNKIIEYVETAH